jgi:hypothetical protein
LEIIKLDNDLEVDLSIDELFFMLSQIVLRTTDEELRSQDEEIERVRTYLKTKKSEITRLKEKLITIGSEYKRLKELESCVSLIITLKREGMLKKGENAITISNLLKNIAKKDIQSLLMTKNRLSLYVTTNVPKRK